MQALSLAEHNSLCVAHEIAPWQIVGMAETTDKNGGPNNLQAWRKLRKLSRDKLAALVGTSPNMIQYLEEGERALSLKWLRRLAPALETTVGWLADYTPDQIDMELHDLFTKRKLSDEQRRQLIAIADAITKTGTDNT